MTLSSEIRLLLRPLGIAIGRLPKWVFTRAIQFSIDAVLATVATFVAFALRFDGSVPAEHIPTMWWVVLTLPIARALTIKALGGHRIVWRYFSLHDAISLIAMVLPCSAFMVVLRYEAPARFWFAHIPAGVIIIEFGSFVLLASAVRILRRMTTEAVGETATTRTFVVGTGETLASAIRHLASSQGIKIIGLLATDERLRGLMIGGHPVIGTVEDLPRLLSMIAVDLVLVSDAGLPCLGSAVETSVAFDVNIRLLPSASNVLRGSVRMPAIVSPERVVARSSPEVEESCEAVAEAYRDRCVLVTGAGGSIGSELCRQISRLPISSLVLFDRDENSIFEVSGELAASAGSKIVPRVGDIRDRYALRRIFESHQPHLVLHAAAYKHVPLMEQNCAEAVLNNIVGTREVAECAFEFGSERFLMISSDKAVHPTSVMGATKRIAEQIVQLMGSGAGPGATRCSCVRFGNVVGSRGSVVPIFLRQIAAGGPITITDETMTRYFMTIPEAVKLVLQASTLGSSGDIYMLDMGDPVKITTLARKLIEMSGLRPDKDIATKVVGARPGEKVHEQLWGEDSDVSKREVSRVFSVKVPLVDKQSFLARLKLLEEAAQVRDENLVRQCLLDMPIGFKGGIVRPLPGRST